MSYQAVLNQESGQDQASDHEALDQALDQASDHQALDHQASDQASI